MRSFNSILPASQAKWVGNTGEQCIAPYLGAFAHRARSLLDGLPPGTGTVGAVSRLHSTKALPASSGRCARPCARGGSPGGKRLSSSATSGRVCVLLARNSDRGKAGGPTAVFEAAGGIFVRPAGALHHAIHRLNRRCELLADFVKALEARNIGRDRVAHAGPVIHLFVRLSPPGADRLPALTQRHPGRDSGTAASALTFEYITAAAAAFARMKDFRRSVA